MTSRPSPVARARIPLVLLALYFWRVRVETAHDALEPLRYAMGYVLTHEWWLSALALAEALRQVHVAGQDSPAYRRLEGYLTAPLRDVRDALSPWARFRLRRAAFWLVILAAVTFLAARLTHHSALTADAALVLSVWHSLPIYLQYLAFILVAILQFVAIFWVMSRGGVDVYYPGDVRTRFADVWGQDAVLERIRENIILLRDPDRIEALGGYVPGGILLWGPPGTGKTLLAEAVAGETSRPFVFVDPGAFTNMFMGVGILKVKALFKKLRRLSLRYGGVVVFFDEADSLGSRGGRVSTATPASASACHGSAYVSGLRDYTVVPGGSGSDGTLQALLTEISGLHKPRGLIGRPLRRALGLAPPPVPKYRILIMMATNMPDSLDPALLRPGRVDRAYRVGYPSRPGRIRTYQGYLSRIRHTLTEDDVEHLATMTPYATGATIKDLVNEALIHAINDGRDVVDWADVVHAKHRKDLGPPDDVRYLARERHAVAVHEACHAVVAVRTRTHLTVDLATIEKGGTYLGMVASIPPSDQFTSWRSQYESDIMVSLASLAGERLFFNGDSSSGVSGDLEAATTIASLMETRWGMGDSLVAREDFGPTPPRQRQVEALLSDLYRRALDLLIDNRAAVLALAHALELHLTVSGDDVIAVVNAQPGPLIDGSHYSGPSAERALEDYHTAALSAHLAHDDADIPLPVIGP